MTGVAADTREQYGRDVDFDRYPSDYEDDVDRSVSFTGWNSAFYARRKVDILGEIVRKGLGPLKELSLLDVGCGTGTTDQVLAPCVRSLHGVDVSSEMLIKAQRNVPEAQFSGYDGARLPFDDGRFDVAVAICVLHHIPVSQRCQVVSAMVRVSRHEGVVALFEDNPYNPLTRHAVNTCELDRDAMLLPPQRDGGVAEEIGRHGARVSPLPLVTSRRSDRLHPRSTLAQDSSWRSVRHLGAAQRHVHLIDSAGLRREPAFP